MAGVTSAPPIRGQFAAIALVRWQLFLNGLRTVRGRLEVVSRILMGFGFAVIGLGGATAVGGMAWFLTSREEIEALALVFWGIFLFWQLFPVMAHALADNIDSSHLLRYPLTFRAYFLIRMAYGSLEPATFVGLFWIFAMGCGIGFASFRLFLWAVPALLLFAAFNILFARMIFAWIERWLARRRTREVLGFVFFLFIIALQFIGPLINHFTRHGDPHVAEYAAQALPLERLSPPGLAAAYLSSASASDIPRAAGKFALLAVYAVAAFWLLNLRLRAYYFGEDLSESVARVKAPAAKARESVHAGWNVPLASSATSAVLQKEIRYILRSGPMLFTLVMPLVILVIFRFSAGQASRGGGSFLARSGELAFPIGAAYSLLILTNLVYNSFGADNGGIQFFFLSPARFREILLGKNMAHALILAADIVLVFAGSCFLYQPPTLVLFFITILGVVFGLLVNLAAGDLLSIFTPKKIDFGTFGRQRASTVTAFASLGVQALTIGLAVGTVLIARALGMLWVAIPAFTVLSAIAAAVYLVVLSRIDGMAIRQREALIAELCRS
jgi:ABC-2 type transport system permease protein